ncbi:uncharacterized protein LOC103316537 [Nasonia vitripennis]|uniref:Uncharacterized protein n=1 Tax=Nasonia vitripennis TaxID=7425 RepID=A0A7M7QGY5_NASVI|nr:uncharacterized protein LOC103316537 [Nasonia vitripennis]XP_031787555.1 uncharacterized protein LOC103316537 [Nasonia vitripennis]
MDDIEKAIARAAKYRYKLYNNTYITKEKRLELCTDIADIVNLRLKTRLSGTEVRDIWSKLRRRFSIRMTDNDMIVHQHLIYLKDYVITKNIDNVDQQSERRQCSKECYKYATSQAMKSILIVIILKLIVDHHQQIVQLIMDHHQQMISFIKLKLNHRAKMKLLQLALSKNPMVKSTLIYPQ